MLLPNEYQAEVNRRESVLKAFDLLRQKPNFPSLHIQVYDRGKALALPKEAHQALTEQRLEYVIERLDLCGESYVQLVSDLESQTAFAILMDEFFRVAWNLFCGRPADTPSPLVVPNDELPERTRQAARINERCTHWGMEAYRLESLGNRQAPEKPAIHRRGYRSHIRAWMKNETISTVPLAAKRLGVSESTLKSIMSEKGDIRYSADTLARVLRETSSREKP
jgi:hypothetical protein